MSKKTWIVLAAVMLAFGVGAQLWKLMLVLGGLGVLAYALTKTGRGRQAALAGGVFALLAGVVAMAIPSPVAPTPPRTFLGTASATPTPTPVVTTHPSTAPATSVTPAAAPSTSADPSTEAVPPAPETSAEAPVAPPAPPETSAAPAPVVPPKTTAASTVFYKNCGAVRAAGAAPLYAGQPGYRPGLDRDGDGIACE